MELASLICEYLGYYRKLYGEEEVKEETKQEEKKLNITQ